ncbi:molybdopterin-synthase adenylyltransferase MoeB [Corticibacter populi]|uniref:Molybdopterin-synthase adenylyltransferase n=1 Tax=Corticibacter populi TaxID=1550736 RepID=A0A3M6QSS7_9BURK|nr:molybdopterin-synthase adenylyltransferase MoeB [Corticibacter populi]RMX06053.1 molybdopterin-synthase adenylyltransferase MoeB [Corticibacter populi]RZS30801.1 adenylyltransferase/sulfurtransferase [Corticibacter populi]
MTCTPLVAVSGQLDALEQARYARHLGLPGFGTEAQLRLKNARVLVLGAGGLGSAVLPYLAAAGVGTIGIVDDDVVELSNLQRQVLHGSAQLGRSKAASASERLQDLNPHVRVVAHRERLVPANALALFGDYDLVIDGTDNFATRYLVSDAAAILGMPCVWGSILQFEGQLSVFWRGHGPTYRDVFPEPPEPGEVPSCAQAGVLGVLPGQIGTLMAAEAIKLITGIGEPLLGRLLLFDALGTRWREMRVGVDPAQAAVTQLAADYQALCGLSPEPRGLPAISAAALAERLQAGTHLWLLDVRQPEEHARAHIEGARLVPLPELAQQATTWPIQPGDAIVVYCQSGPRARQAAAWLAQQGYADLQVLEGGMGAWQQHLAQCAAGH